MWEPRRLTALWTSTVCYRDSFTFFTFIRLLLFLHCPVFTYWNSVLGHNGVNWNNIRKISRKGRNQKWNCKGRNVTIEAIVRELSFDLCCDESHVVHVPQNSAESMTLQTFNWEVRSSNLSRVTDYSHWGILLSFSPLRDLLCGLVVRVPGYRSRGPGSIPGATRFSEK
jgi:hypothetical protein